MHHSLAVFKNVDNPKKTKKPRLTTKSKKTQVAFIIFLPHVSSPFLGFRAGLYRYDKQKKKAKSLKNWPIKESKCCQENTANTVLNSLIG